MDFIVAINLFAASSGCSPDREPAGGSGSSPGRSIMAISAIWWMPYSCLVAHLHIAIGIVTIYALLDAGPGPEPVTHS